MSEILAIIGEVHTALLHHSSAISVNSTESLLRFVEGERVRRSQRPVEYQCSPETLTGVDCRLPMSNRAAVHAVGTVAVRASITQGRLVQSSAHVTVVRRGSTRRQSWAHYLAQPGVVETIGGRADTRHIGQGALNGPGPGDLDLGAICTRVLDRVQHRPELDHTPAFRVRRGRLRWVVAGHPATTDATVFFGIGADEIRRLRIPRFDASIAAHLDLCDDIALHDWLLTALVTLVGRGLESRRATDVLSGLRPAVDHLLHLWMPGARTAPALRAVWDAVEEHPGLSRQWRVNVDRVRDQLALQTLERLSTT